MPSKYISAMLWVKLKGGQVPLKLSMYIDTAPSEDYRMLNLLPTSTKTPIGSHSISLSLCQGGVAVKRPGRVQGLLIQEIIVILVPF